MTEKRRAPRSAEIVNKEDFVEQFYVDGVSNIVFSAANCKVDLFQIVGSADDTERRRVVKTLVLPTPALVEMCRNVLASFSKTREQMESAFEQHHKRVFSNLPGDSPDSAE